MEDVLPFLGPVLEILAGKSGGLAQTLGWVVASSAIVQSLEVFAKAVVAVTPGDSDDAWLNKQLNSSWYGWVKKVFGLFLNVKLPEKK